MKKARVLSAARLELVDIVTWYEDRQPGLGARFLETVDRTLATLADRQPRRLLIGGRQDLWWVPVGRWPYKLLFVERADLDVLPVFAIAHERRRPGYWKPRLAALDG